MAFTFRPSSGRGVVLVCASVNARTFLSNEPMVLAHFGGFDVPVVTKGGGHRGMWCTPLRPQYPRPAAASSPEKPHGRDLGQVLSQIAPMQRGLRVVGRRMVGRRMAYGVISQFHIMAWSSCARLWQWATYGPTKSRK